MQDLQGCMDDSNCQCTIGRTPTTFVHCNLTISFLVLYLKIYVILKVVIKFHDFQLQVPMIIRMDFALAVHEIANHTYDLSWWLLVQSFDFLACNFSVKISKNANHIVHKLICLFVFFLRMLVLYWLITFMWIYYE